MPRALRMTGLVSLGFLLASVTPALPAVPPDVLQGWQAYTQRLRHATGTIRLVNTTRDGNEISTQTVTISFAFGTHGRRMEEFGTERLASRNKEYQLPHRVFCENSQYVFQLNRSNNGWILHKLILANDAPGEERTPTIRDRLSVLEDVYMLVAIKGEFLTNMADHLQCQGDDTTVVSLVKEYRTTLHRRPWAFRSLSLHLNADEYHTVRSATAEVRIDNKIDVTFTITNEYQVVNGLPVPLRSMRRGLYRWGDHVVEVDDTYEYQVDPSIDPPEREFTLSAFGLPEPVGVVWEKRTPVYVWLLVAAGVLLTLGIFFRWLARRLRRGHSEG